MAAFKSSSQSKIRSISLPSRSHPTTERIEEELNKLKSWEVSVTPNAETICKGLFGLAELHRCMADLLSLPLTLQALSKHHGEKWVDQLLDKSVRLLDICGIIRDLVSQFKECLRDTQSSLRRKRDLNSEATINRYSSFAKMTKKEAKKLIATLRQMDHEIEDAVLLDVDHHVSAVIRVLKEVYAMSNSIFQMVLLFLSVPISKPTPTKWSLVSRLVQKGGPSCEGQDDIINGIENVEMALFSLCKKGSKQGEEIYSVQSRLQSLEEHFQSFENGLDGVFRCLIRSRSSLLNITSC